MADIKTGTEKAELKNLLKRATQDHPVRCAVGQGKEGAYALLMVDKTKQPKAISVEMEKAFDGMKNPRWGTAYPDVNRAEADPAAPPAEPPDEKLVVFLVNKPASGMAKRLAKTLKLNMTGFSKVELRFEDGSPTERVLEEEDEAAAQDGAAPQSAAPPPPPPPPPPAADGAALKKQLGELIPKIAGAAGADDGLKARLMKLAGDANGALKTNALAEAATHIAALQAGIAGGGKPAAPNASPTGAVAYAKSRLAWIAARKKMESEVEKLRAEIVAYYQGEDLGGDLNAAYSNRVAPMLAALDEELADKLDDATNATDPAARAKLVAEAKEAIARYQAYLAGDKTIAALDKNPFVPLTIQQTITSTLAALSAAVH